MQLDGMYSAGARVRSLLSTRGQNKHTSQDRLRDLSAIASLCTCIFSIIWYHSHISTMMVKCAKLTLAATAAGLEQAARHGSRLHPSFHASPRPPSNLTIRFTSHNHRHSPFGHFLLVTHLSFFACIRIIPIQASLTTEPYTCCSSTTNAYPASILKPTPPRLTQLKPGPLETRHTSHPEFPSTERRRSGAATVPAHYL
jgi:hypothetical protein